MTVVPTVVDRMTEPPEWSPFKTFPTEEIESEMTVHVHEERECCEHQQHREMQRKHQREEKEYDRLDQGLEWVKSECSHRSGFDGQVVHPVNEAKNPGMVHQTVGPVKVGVVEKEHDQKTECVPEPSVLSDVEVELPHPHGHQHEPERRRDEEDQSREDRVADFTPQVFRVRRLFIEKLRLRSGERPFP